MNTYRTPTAVQGRRLAFAPVILMLAFGAYLVWRGEQAGINGQWVKHTEAVLDAANSAECRIRDAEASQRGYLITGEPEYLGQYHHGHDSIAVEMKHLRSLTADNPVEAVLIARLLPIVALKVKLIDSTIALRASGNGDSALEIVRKGQGKQLMDSATGIFGQMIAEENRLLEERVAREEADTKSRFALYLLSVALSALTSLLVAMRLSDNAAHQWLVSAELTARNEVLSEQARDFEQRSEALRQQAVELQSELSLLRTNSDTARPGPS